MTDGLRQTADAARCLRDGGILLLATDTVPGLHARADDFGAVRRILAVKGCLAGKALLVLAGSQEQAAAITGPLTLEQEAVCRRCWPGPFSLILPAAVGLSPLVTGGRQTVAVRVPALPELCELLLLAGGPMVSTSANRSGEPHAQSMEVAREHFAAEVDGYWTTAQGADVQREPSALVDLTTEPPCLLRAGNVPFPR